MEGVGERDGVRGQPLVRFVVEVFCWSLLRFVGVGRELYAVFGMHLWDILLVLQ